MGQSVEALHDGRSAAARAAAAAALALARGPLLPDDEGAWVAAERQRCAALVARARSVAAEAALAADDPAAPPSSRPKRRSPTIRTTRHCGGC